MARFILFDPKDMGPDRLEDKCPSSGSSAGDLGANNAVFVSQYYRGLQTLRAADRDSNFLVSVNGGVFDADTSIRLRRQSMVAPFARMCFSQQYSCSAVAKLHFSAEGIGKNGNRWSLTRALSS